MRLAFAAWPALAALPLLAACAASPPPSCFVSGEQAAGMASSSSSAEGFVLRGGLGTGCVTLPFAYAPEPGRDEGSLVLGATAATLTVTGLAASDEDATILGGAEQARLTLTATFPVPVVPGAEAVAAGLVRRALDAGGAVREVSAAPGTVTATLTAFDPRTGRVAGFFRGSVPLAWGGGGIEPVLHAGSFESTVVVTAEVVAAAP